MIIKLLPQRRDDALVVLRSGNLVIVNGEPFDFSSMNDGDTLPHTAIRSEWFVGDVEKIDGELTLTLLLPNPSNCSPAQALPVDLINVPNGLVVFPPPLPEASIAIVSEVLP
ncbi:hypothetical protein IMW75_13695 [Pseudomonas gregormendelii]|uniref:Uncharacterized protein n=1 Tax=Pseudomonas gregormendelii TaxID=1628277 RepID=A0ABS3AJ93_9PSED|nr:hypothetical protein [Pseudomonas gregormendelii]MBN3966324.1 hypothetical protein [Pseudomonas gregormendelii]